MTKKRLDEDLYEFVAKAMFVNYESVYDIDVETSAYNTYHESEPYKKLKLKKSGDNFFAAMEKRVPEIICPDDTEYVLHMLERNTLIKGIREEGNYSFLYRVHREGKDVYHQIRAVMQSIKGKEHILLGVCDVDAVIRREMSHRKEIESMHQKEKNHMKAVLGSAAGYLEANLSKNEIIEMSLSFASSGNPSALVEEPKESMSYSDFEKWFCENYVVSDPEKYSTISNREYLVSNFEQGGRRVAVSFYARSDTDGERLCKKVFYLYRDNPSGNIFAFCVLYDLTEQQRREAEFEQLQNELRMSRLRNFTGQMQPHFLYNALGSIQEIVLEDPEYASELIGDFSTHLRSCVKAMTGDDTVPFSQELENIKAYVNIEKMRFGDKLKIKYEIKAEDFAILPLCIQPLVENAIRHGIYEKGTEGGTVVIRTREEKDYWIVEVEDDGIGFDVDTFMSEKAAGKRDSYGLLNIIFRLDKVMNAKLDIASKEGVGTKVTVFIPKGGTKNENDNS